MGKIKSSIVAILLILSALLVAMNFAAPVTGPANDSTARAPRLTDTDFHWGDMIVSSEPTIGQDNNDDSFDPEVAVENEKVYMVWYDGTDLNGVGGTYDIFFRMYDGTSWSTIEVLSEPTLGGADDNFGNSEAPDIAVENGNVYVVWIDNWKPPGFSGGDYDILYRHFDGTQWGPIQVISEPNFSGNDNAGESYNPSIAVDNSKVYVVWRDETDITAGGTGDYDIFYRTNLTTTGWEEIQVISETVSGDDLINTATDAPNIAADNGKHYIVWQDDLNFDSSGGDFEIFYRANLTNAWEDLQVISEPIPGQDINTGVSAFPSIAVETDKLYVAWSDNNDTNGASGTNTDFDIFYRCNLTQSNWEATQVLSEPIPNSDTNDGFSDEPDITVENDIIYVIWEDEYDFKNASKNFADTDIFFTYNSSGGGGGWSEFFIVSEPAEEQDINDADSQSDPAIAVNLGKCHIFWDDNNDTDSSGTDRDINYRPTFVAPSLTSPAVTPAIGNTSTVFKYTVTYIDPDNEGPTQITIKVNGGTAEPMTASTPGDTFFLDGNEYFYETTLGIGSSHNYEFSASDGVYTRGIGPFDGPDVLNTAPNITTPDNAT
ncbi:MAG: hypothetical protein KAJ51_02565, partial [Thermoplasmata archaeon]|nr:hypothetical protein [Thermoplasmata archaeon]